MDRYLGAALAAVLLLTGCSAPDQATSQGDPDAIVSPTSQEEEGAPEKEGSGDKSKGGDAESKKDGAGKRGGPSQEGPGEGNENDDGERVAAEPESSSEDDRSSATHPAAGTYMYAQKGYEEYCQAANCDRHDLPDRQRVVARIGDQGGEGTVVVTEAHASEGQLVRTTTRYTPELALITQVYIRFEYEGFTFESTYDPKPPVESLRFPLTVGETWSGSWEARTSGDYSIDVQGRDTVSVGGRSVRAFVVDTRTTLRGELRGEGEATLWIDPATLAVVKSAGQLQVSSAFGDYNTAFTLALRSGPSYR